MEAVLILGFVALLVIVAFQQISARRTEEIVTDLSAGEAQQVVESVFGRVMSGRSAGRGDINVTPRLKLGPPTVSIDIEEGAGGTRSVSVWVSEYTTRVGCMLHAGWVIRKRWTLRRKLTDSTQPSAAHSTLTQPRPPDLVERLERFGRHEWAIPNSPYDSHEIWTTVLEPMWETAQQEPARLVDILAKEVSPVGGWAAYGAEHLMYELVSEPSQYPGYDVVMDAALDFLRENNVPPMRVTGHEWKYWLDNGGTVDTWVSRLPTPSTDETPITPLAPGESRKLAQVSSADNSNVIYVTSGDGGGVVALIDARRSDDDPTRVRSEWKRASTQFELYLDIAHSLQSVHWCDPELKPFFPIPACHLPLS